MVVGVRWGVGGCDRGDYLPYGRGMKPDYHHLLFCHLCCWTNELFLTEHRHPNWRMMDECTHWSLWEMNNKYSSTDGYFFIWRKQRQQQKGTLILSQC